jgi:hypothetical protein
MPEEPEQRTDDDERVICSMDVEGMPPRGIAANFKRQRHGQATAWPASHPGQLTRYEARRYTGYSILAGLLIVLVYSVALALFILFCTEIWFR